jgi:hypothetical protein
MDPQYYGLVEMTFSFGLMLAFGVWQLVSTARAKRRRIEREKRER